MQLSTDTRNVRRTDKDIACDVVRRVSIVRTKDRRKHGTRELFTIVIDGLEIATVVERTALNDFLDELKPEPILTLVDDKAPESFDPYNTARFRKVYL